MWNLPFNGISVAMGGITVDKIVNDPGLRELAGIIMDETIAVGNAGECGAKVMHHHYIEIAACCNLFVGTLYFLVCFDDAIQLVWKTSRQ